MEELTVSDGTDTAILRKVAKRKNQDVDQPIWSLTTDVPREHSKRLIQLLEAAAQAISFSGGGKLEFWIENISEETRKTPINAGYEPFRDLLRMKRSLPGTPSNLLTRSFNKNDYEDILRINNSAFDWHPDQAGMTKESLLVTQNESWYLEDGFRVLEVEKIVTGFCWTKIHSELKSIKGEIYVIALDPERQGEGLGRELVLSGMEWLSARKIKEIFLYVEADNHRAVKMYKSMGFDVEYTNQCFQRVIRNSPKSQELESETDPQNLQESNSQIREIPDRN